MNVEKYVFPIFREIPEGTDFIGNGFFVGNLFITAEHVINPGKSASPDTSCMPYIMIGDRQVSLTNKVELDYKSLEYDDEDHAFGHEDKDRTDLCVYILSDVDINSPLRLATSIPSPGQQLLCDFYHHRKDSLNPSQKEIQVNSRHLYYWETKAIVASDKNCFLGNFFGAQMKPTHPEGGSSGSPLFDNNNIVYGILHVGKEDFCGFYAAAHANQLLRQAQIFT